MIRITLLVCVLLTGSLFAADDTMDDSQVMEYLAINPLTLKTWTAQGHLKAYSAGGKIFYKRDNVEAVKKTFEESKKQEAAKGTAQVNDRDFGREQTLGEREAQRQKELAARGAGATAEQRTGAANKTDYRQAEIDKKRAEVDAVRNGRSGDVKTDDRQAERDRALRDRDSERNAKRL
jgi:hypothetical protein